MAAYKIISSKTAVTLPPSIRHFLFTVMNILGQNKRLRCLSIIVISALACHIQWLHAANIPVTTLTQANNEQQIPLSVQYLRAGKKYYQAQTLFNIDTGFTNLKSKGLYLSMPAPTWVRFNVDNRHDKDLSYTLDLGSIFINEATLYYYQNDKLIKKQAGLNFSKTRDVIQNKNINFKINIPALQEKTYLLHIDSHFYNRFTPKLLTDQGTYESQNLEQAFSYTLIGIIIGGICYLLLISLIINERKENYYFITYLITSSIIISFNHTDTYKVFAFYPRLFEISFALFMSINVISFIIFYQRFFATHKLFKFGHQILKSFSILYSGLFILSFFYQYQYFYVLYSVLTSLLLTFLLRFSWINWRNKVPYTLHFSFCFFTALAINSLYLLNHLNLIADNLLLSFGFAIANALLVLVFAINLSKHIIEVRDQQIQAASSAARAIAESDAKSDFLAKMSHEIRTPMNGVLGMVQLLKATTLNNTQKDYIQVIEQSGSTLVTVINDILDYSKVEAGKMTLETSPLSIADLINNIKLIFNEQIQAKELIFQTHIHENVPQAVLGDQNRITQILINLIANSIKFTETGSINIEVQNLYKNVQKKNVLRFSVTDTGIGIAKERLDKLFKAFEQADTSTTRIYGGTGLGLAICEQLIHLMKGKIGIHSEQGQGTSIWFDIPLKETHVNNINTEQETITVSANNPIIFKHNKSAEKKVDKPKPILVAEDNDVNQKVLSGMLKQLGYQADYVNNGLQALSLAKQHHDHYQLILMDCEMPIMDGYTASDKIRAWEHKHCLARLPIIAVTAHALNDMRDKSIAHGMDDHLSKPIKLNTLSTSINQWLIRCENS